MQKVKRKLKKSQRTEEAKKSMVKRLPHKRRSKRKRTEVVNQNFLGRLDTSLLDQ